MDKAIVVSVPIVVKGEAAGVKQQGGLLDFVTREIQVQCLPTDIPEHIDVDVSELMLHQSIRVKDIAANPKWKAVTDGETMLVHIVMPKAEESAATTAAEGAAAAPAAAAPAEPRSSRRARRGEGRQEVAADLQVRLPMKLIVGLGNPGREYRDTRHNVGFMVADEVARRYQSDVRDGAIAGSGRLRGEEVRRAAVDGCETADVHEQQRRRGGGAARYYDVPIDDLLVVVDEVALPFGRLRARARGSAEGTTVSSR
jgi:hypothetical protein